MANSGENGSQEGWQSILADLVNRQAPREECPLDSPPPPRGVLLFIAASDVIAQMFVFFFTWKVCDFSFLLFNLKNGCVLYGLCFCLFSLLKSVGYITPEQRPRSDRFTCSNNGPTSDWSSYHWPDVISVAFRPRAEIRRKKNTLKNPFFSPQINFDSN